MQTSSNQNRSVSCVDIDATSLARKLTVIAVPSQRLAYTNCAFVGTGALNGAEYLMVNGEYLFRVKESAEIGKDELALNSLQRRFASLSEHRLVSAHVFAPPATNFALTSLSVEINSLNKFTGSVDCQAFVKEMREGSLSGMPFAPQQMYVVDFCGTLFILPASSISCTTVDNVVDKFAVPAPKARFGVVQSSRDIILQNAT